MTETISIDPTDLLPGDVVVSLDGCISPGEECDCRDTYHRDITVTVRREIKPDIRKAISELPEGIVRSLEES